MAVWRTIVMLFACSPLAVCAREVPTPASPEYTAAPDPAKFSHALWEAFLTDRVDAAGMVDYAAARDDARLNEYLFRLANTRVEALPDSAARKAFWINAYNALAIQGVLKTLPADAGAEAVARYRVVDLPLDGLPPNKGFFEGLKFVVGGQRFALDEIEKRILLRKGAGLTLAEKERYAAVAPEAGDARVHFALVCCAHGCPRLQTFAYVPERIDAQLDEAVRGFIRDPGRSRFDPQERVWRVSELLNWYGADFANPAYRPSSPSLLVFASRYVADEHLRVSLTKEAWRLEFLKYDWRLNIQHQ